MSTLFLIIFIKNGGFMLEDIKGLGPKSILYLNELKIYDIKDLLEYYPYRYNVYKPNNISDAHDDETLLINGMIEPPIKVFFIKRNLNKLSFKLNTEKEIINVSVFNRAFLKKNMIVGKTISVIGKYNKKSNSLVASDIKMVPILKTTIEGVYHLNANIKRANFKKIIETAVNNNFYVSSLVPSYLAEKYNFVSKMSAVREMHFPKSIEALKQAKIFLIYEELFAFMLKMNYLKMSRNNNNEIDSKMFDEKKVNDFILSLPFKLTDDQLKAVEEIKCDFKSTSRMNRLILGDVGSGKTIVAFISLYMNYLAGFQGVLMAPTELLALQHYNNIISTFKNMNVNVCLLTSSTKKKDRLLILEDLKSGKCNILIGTHSVLNNEVVFKNIGLVITDEQHRFGVAQRKNLQNKGDMTDVLYLSATPIPRTLALTLFGDMDISQIKTKPANRKQIYTKLYKNNEIKSVLKLMLDEIKNNHQIYVVAPLIEDEEGSSSMENVISLKEKINVAFNGKVPLEVLHGKLSAKEKEQIMNDFKLGIIKILISTTVIEVGVDVKNATMMVVFNAERFGLATLHQLRGRIGRNDLESKCLLVSDYDTPRLKILEETNDGFLISEKDFELRGSGDLFGVRQSGDMSFKIANLARDFKILKQCDTDSKEFISNHLNEIKKFPEQKMVLDSVFLNN